MTIEKNRLNCLKVLGVFVTVAVTGCGGGGGGYDNGGGGGFPGGGTTATYGTVLGRVVDEGGKVVPGANVNAQGSNVGATTLSQGGFQLNQVPSGIQTITANESVNNVNYTGSTQVLILDNKTVSNAGIEVSRSDTQGSVTGTVTDSGGNPLRDARVFLGVFATPPTSTSTGDVASLVGFTDSQGRYRINNIPADVSHYTIAASLLGYQNDITTLDNLTVGEVRRLDFSLNNSSNQSVATPQNVSAQSFTQPSVPSNSRAITDTSGVQSVYDQIRRILSPQYAKLRTGRHLAAKTQKLATGLKAHFNNSYVVENDLYFDESQINSLSGFRIYNSQGSDTLQPYDFLQDPLASFYSDLSSYYTADQKYNFAVSAVNTDSQESSLSPTVSVVPLEQLNVNQPQDGQSLSNPVTFNWNSVTGASSYAVFVYNQFPGVGVTPLVTKTDISGNATSATLSGTLTSSDYWAIVAASADNGTEISVSQIVRFHVN